MMTNRERILSVLAGKSPDQIPWIARLQLWYNARVAEGNLPERYSGKSLRQVEQMVGSGNPARDGRIFQTRYEGIEVEVSTKGEAVQTRFITPVGTVCLEQIKSEELSDYSDAGLPLGHPLKRVEDYAVWEYVAEHTYYDPIYDDYLAYEDAVGDDGYPLVGAGDCPFHYWELHLAGYNEAFFHLYDYQNEVEHLLKVMEQVERERLWPVVANSPAKLILHGIHFDSQMTPPHLFERYITPYYKDFSTLLRAKGKTLAYHADDDSQLILKQIKEAGFGLADCFCTAPMVNVTLAEAREAWGKDVIIWGGVPSVILEESFPEKDFEAYVENIFRVVAPGDAFILGVADNVMPTSQIERVEHISHMVQRLGRYPVMA